MPRRSFVLRVCFHLSFGSVLLVAGTAWGRPSGPAQELAEPEIEVDLVGDVDGTNPLPQKALQDTIWIAEWTFDTGAPCSETGWTHVDNHILNDGVQFWHIETGFTTATGMAGNSFAVGYHANVCCADSDGYDNNWYQGVRITYTDVAGAGTPTLSLDYIVDSEAGFDFLNIETDSLCLSYARVNFNIAPNRAPAAYRKLRGQADGLNTNGEFSAVALDENGAGTHCVYIAFFADGGFSPCDGDQPTTVGEAAIIDNIVLVDGSGTRTEDFEDGVLSFGTALNIADSVPFGTWARLYEHISDNDVCSENRTCAWLWTDYTTPTLFNDPSMSFGPGGYVVRNWLDDVIVSPWVSLASTPSASGTLLNFRRFPGNFFETGRIVQNWSVRGKDGTCVSGWGHASQWNSLSFFAWQSLLFDMAPYFDPTSTHIQIRHRTSDWQWIAGAPLPAPSVPGPGPYTDRTRIGRRVLTGPVINEGIDSRSQGQDCFPTEIHPGITPAGQHFRPTTDRFGTCAFSEGTELAIGKRPNVVTGDSINISVRAIRPVPGGNVVSSVTFHGAVVAGPHQGKAVPTTMATAPPPWSVGANGFFSFAADTVRSASGSPLANNYFADMNDFYFRGGDVLQYLWAATDAAGGFTSDPLGLSALPTSIAQAQAATGGLFEVNFLPVNNWDPAYLAAITADDYGDIAPTAGQIANSTQKNCILYVQNIVTRRLSGQVNRTSFMYSLDRLGYGPTATDPHGHYDVYDHQGMGNTNNQLGGRATIQQCQGYSLIVYDNGNGTPGRPLLPDGINLDSQNIDQATWFRNWLTQAVASEAGRATLWMLGSNTVAEKPTNTLISTTMGVTFVGSDQGLNVNPEVDGVASFTFDTGAGSSTVDFGNTLYTLNGGCPVVRNYDTIDANGTAIRTHRYRDPVSAALGGGAIVMNRNDAGGYNTIQQTHPWFDIADNADGPTTQPELTFLEQILAATLPAPCQHSPNPATGTGEDPNVDALPRQTVLHQNVPNPFNPMTEIRFDLAQTGRVQLRIYDVAGRLVRTLVDKDMSVGRNHTVVWNGLDDQNNKVASGVYFYRLDAVDKLLTRKMVVMK